MKPIRSFLLGAALLFPALGALAQTGEEPFRAHLYNKEYDVNLHIDLINQQMQVPEHELYGPLAGYMGKGTSTFYWVIVSAKVKGQEATLQLINDFGSEDLTATLRQHNDSTYVLTQGKGSTIKFYNGKWQKMPTTMEFIKK